MLNNKPPAIAGGATNLLYKKITFPLKQSCSGYYLTKGKVILMANQTNSMAHTKWMCKYHIVFTPKYRRKVIYNQYKEDIRDIIKALCKYKGVEIIEGHLMPDHIHMLVSIPPKYSISQFMGYLKGKSALTGISLLTFVTVHSYLVPVTDFADASHSKSAKSATTTVSYGIFSSENAYL